MHTYTNSYMHIYRDLTLGASISVHGNTLEAPLIPYRKTIKTRPAIRAARKHRTGSLERGLFSNCCKLYVMQHFFEYCK